VGRDEGPASPAAATGEGGGVEPGGAAGYARQINPAVDPFYRFNCDPRHSLRNYFPAILDNRFGGSRIWRKRAATRLQSRARCEAATSRCWAGAPRCGYSRRCGAPCARSPGTSSVGFTTSLAHRLAQASGHDPDRGDPGFSDVVLPCGGDRRGLPPDGPWEFQPDDAARADDAGHAGGVSYPITRRQTNFSAKVRRHAGR
jgi:hypothetical protein